jgi:hypothetical protein
MAMTAPGGHQPTVTELFVDLIDPGPAASGSEQFRLLDEDDPPPPGSQPSPWPPIGFPRPQPGKPTPESPSTNSRMHVKVDPPPDHVPHSGKPVGIFGCRDNRFTWYYDQYVTTDSGLSITVRSRDNFFDGRWVSENKDGFNVAGNSSVVLHTRWCSAVPRPHYTQHRFQVEVEGGERFTFYTDYIALLSP